MKCGEATPSPRFGENDAGNGRIETFGAVRLAAAGGGRPRGESRPVVQVLERTERRVRGALGAGPTEERRDEPADAAIARALPLNGV